MLNVPPWICLEPSKTLKQILCHITNQFESKFSSQKRYSCVTYFLVKQFGADSRSDAATVRHCSILFGSSLTPAVDNVQQLSGVESESTMSIAEGNQIQAQVRTQHMSKQTPPDGRMVERKPHGGEERLYQRSSASDRSSPSCESYPLLAILN